MNPESVAPCGLICDLCLAAQRKKNACAGCTSAGEKPAYCGKCIIRNCEEKIGKENQLCMSCSRYPCKRLKSLEKRYTVKYGESLMGNFKRIDEVGMEVFIKEEEENWKCRNCGALLCVHHSECLKCGAENHRFPSNTLPGKAT